MMRLTTAQIGRCGELLVQHELLLHGIESAAMTTDTGIDLVAYSPAAPRPLTIQVKAKLRPTPGGGKGAPALDWWVPDTCPADLVALVDLSTKRIWLLRTAEVGELAPQHSGSQWHLGFYTVPAGSVRARKTPFAEAFEGFLLPNRVATLFGIEGDAPKPTEAEVAFA